MTAQNNWVFLVISHQHSNLLLRRVQPHNSCIWLKLKHQESEWLCKIFQKQNIKKKKSYYNVQRTDKNWSDLFFFSSCWCLLEKSGKSFFLWFRDGTWVRDTRNGRGYRRELCQNRKQSKTELNGKPLPHLEKQGQYFYGRKSGIKAHFIS